MLLVAVEFRRVGLGKGEKRVRLCGCGCFELMCLWFVSSCGLCGREFVFVWIQLCVSMVGLTLLSLRVILIVKYYVGTYD